MTGPRASGMAGLQNQRVVFVLPTMDVGGAERQALLLGRLLKDRHGCDCEFWSFSGPGPLAELCEQAGIPTRVSRFGWHRNLLPLGRRLLHLARDLRRASPDILMPYTRQPNLACGLVWRLTGAATCVWNQRDSGTGEGLWLRGTRMERLAVRNTPVCVSNSAHGADLLREKLGARPGRVHVVPNGLESRAPQSSRAAWRRQLGLGEDDIAACMVANLHQNKDHETLIRAWPLVSAALAPRRCALLLAGKEWKRGPVLRALASELGAHVQFLGLVEDVAGLLQASDLGVFSSLAEGCPNAVLECMDAGLALVATDTAGIRDVVGADYTFLAAPGLPEACAAQVIALARDGDRRRAVGVDLQARCRTRFSVDTMVAAVAGLLAEAVRGQRKGRAVAPRPVW